MIAISAVASSSGFSIKNQLVLAHAVLFGLAFFFVSPAAILIARFCRKSPWFKWHALLHLFALVLVFAGLGLGIYRTGAHHFDSLHTQLGFAVSLIVALQVAVGMIAHSQKTVSPAAAARLPSLSRKPLLRLTHIFSGMGIVVLGWYASKTGIDKWAKKLKIPHGVYVAFWVLIGFWTILYIAGWTLEALRSRQSVAFRKQELELVESNGSCDEEKRI